MWDGQPAARSVFESWVGVPAKWRLGDLTRGRSRAQGLDDLVGRALGLASVDVGGAAAQDGAVGGLDGEHPLAAADLGDCHCHGGLPVLVLDGVLPRCECARLSDVVPRAGAQRRWVWPRAR